MKTGESIRLGIDMVLLGVMLVVLLVGFLLGYTAGLVNA